jgi:hypothetical protein
MFEDGSQKMKRSEVILNIVNVLRLTGNHYCDDGRDEQDAEMILTRMEAVGMLPPKACIERSVRVGDEQRTAYHNTNEWESEE